MQQKLHWKEMQYRFWLLKAFLYFSIKSILFLTKYVKSNYKENDKHCCFIEVPFQWAYHIPASLLQLS